MQKEGDQNIQSGEQQNLTPQSDISKFMYHLVEKYALSSDERAHVDINSHARGGIGGRGFGQNTLGIEVGWWVHPDRYQKEIIAVNEALQIGGNESIVTFGCGPAFHET